MQRNSWRNIFGPEESQWAKEAPEGLLEGSSTHQGTPGGPGAPKWVLPPRVPPEPPLCSINTQIFQKP